MDVTVSVVAGGLSGVAVDAVLFPLDTIKTRLQTRRHAVDAGQMPRAPPRGAFYRGLLSAMVGSFPAAATFWTGYEAGKAVFTPLARSEAGVAASHAAAAALADVMVTFVRNPFEVVKQQMQAGMHATTAEAVRTIVRSQGVRGLYAGYLSTVAREIPFDAIEFTVYERLKAGAARRQRRVEGAGAQLQWWHNAALGSVAGGLAAGVTTPLDVVKTRMMTQATTAAAARYTGWGDAFTRIAREEGARALFSGVLPRVAWISLGGAIFIGTFEEVKRRMGGEHRVKGGVTDL